MVNLYSLSYSEITNEFLKVSIIYVGFLDLKMSDYIQNAIFELLMHVLPDLYVARICYGFVLENQAQPQK